MVHPASRDFALLPNGSRRFQTVRTGSIPATSTLIMPLTRRFIESARTTVRLRDGAGLLTCDDAGLRSRA